MKRIVLTLALLAPCAAIAQQPSVDQFKRALESQLQRLKPTGFTERTVLFGEVVAGRASGGRYPFQATVVVHDYGPGYPKNRYYGQTCVGRFDKQAFDMLQDNFGNWIVQGRLTPNSQCKDNPAEGVSAVPVNTLPGSRLAPAKTGEKKDKAPADKSAAKKGGALYVGEYACYGAGGRPMAGMGFRLQAGGRYTDLDGARGGSYVYDAAAGTINFRGGYLDGQVGKGVSARGFSFTANVSCEPWR